MTCQLIVALDVPSLKDIAPVVDALPDDILYYKVGLELFTSAGPNALQPLRERNKNVFLDLKLHDIPRTVARTVAAAAQHEVSLLTLHAGGGRTMLTEAARIADQLGTHAPKLLAVTALTSLDSTDLQELGVARDLPEHAASLAALAVASGIHGLVCSPLEVAALRNQFGRNPLLVTPGIRLAHSHDDQKRVATPEAAASSGADFIVVGRPILQAEHPGEIARNILNRITAAQPSDNKKPSPKLNQTRPHHKPEPTP